MRLPNTIPAKSNKKRGQEILKKIHPSTARPRRRSGRPSLKTNRCAETPSQVIENIESLRLKKDQSDIISYKYILL